MSHAESEQSNGLLDLIFAARWISAIAVLFAGLGATLMMVVGAITTVRGIGDYFGAGKHEAFSEEAALATTLQMVSALDEFLLGLVLFIFGYGVYSLFIAPAELNEGRPDWFAIRNVTDLKVKLLETITILLAVLFLKAALKLGPAEEAQWTDLVIPISVGIFALSILLIKRAH